MSYTTSDTEYFEQIKADMLEQLRYELGGWEGNQKLLRRAFMAAVAELVDDDFGGAA